MSDHQEPVAPDVHPEAFVAPNATVLGNVRLAREASVWYGSVLRGDLEPIIIGERTNIQDHSVVHTDKGLPTHVGARVGVGHRCLLHGCVIEDDCLVGMGAIVLSGAVIETGSVIGAGALITEGMRVPPGSLVLGMPGRVIRRVDDALRERIDHTWRDYVQMAREHRAGWYRPPLSGEWEAGNGEAQGLEGA